MSTDIRIAIAKVFLRVLAIAIAEIKTKRGKKVGSLTPSELTSIIILLIAAFTL